MAQAGFSNKTILTSGTGELAGSAFTITKSDVPAKVNVVGLGAGDTAKIKLQESHDGGTTWADVYDATALVTANYQSQTFIKLDYPGRYRVYRLASTGTITAYLVKGNTIESI